MHSRGADQSEIKSYNVVSVLEIGLQYYNGRRHFSPRLKSCMTIITITVNNGSVLRCRLDGNPFPLGLLR